MKYIISDMLPLVYLDKDRKTVKKNGYAFLNEDGNCLIIAYGESRKKEIIKYIEKK